MVGFLISLSVCLWWGLGAFFVPPRPPTEVLPMSTVGCLDPNSTLYGFNDTNSFGIVSTEVDYTANIAPTTPPVFSEPYNTSAVEPQGYVLLSSSINSTMAYLIFGTELQVHVVMMPSCVSDSKCLSCITGLLYITHRLAV